ncbi:MAG: hypothetical protein ACP5E3_00540, partial [Bacteroidales bacterium]
ATASFAMPAAIFKLNLLGSIRFAKLLYHAVELLLAATLSILQAAGGILWEINRKLVKADEDAPTTNSLINIS